jgi:hypothetical protein
LWTLLAPSWHEVLDEVTAFLSRFSVFPDEHCAPTLALWFAHTHAAEHFYITPVTFFVALDQGLWSPGPAWLIL